MTVTKTVLQKSSSWLILALGVLIFFVTSRPELHHFDDFSYLYAAKHYSIHALTHGEFESSNVAGFYNTKIGHILVLKAFIAVFGDGLAAIRAIELAYSLIVVLCGVVLAETVISLQRPSEFKASAIGALFLVTPVSVYLAGKLLAEGPALLCAMLSMLMLTLTLRRSQGGTRWALGAAASLFLVLSVYSRAQLAVLPFGFCAALLLVPPAGLSREYILRVVAAMGIGAVALLALIDWIADLAFLRGFMTAMVVSTQHTDLRAKLDKIIDAFGILLFAVPASLFLLRRRETRFFLAWFICASAPLLLLFSYVETRWLLVGAPALAALTYLCAEYFSNLLTRVGLAAWTARTAAVVVLAVATVWCNRLLQPRTEYGLDQVALVKTKEWIDSQYPGKAIMVPWTHSDYHFLSFAYPRDPIYTANTLAFFTPVTYIQDGAKWPEAMRQWYGDRYVYNEATLRLSGSGPWLAVAWNRSPGSWDGFKSSWLAFDEHITRKVVHRDGPYQVYLIEMRDSPSASGPG